MEKDINQLISQNDDHLVASIVSQCREIMDGYPTVTKMTACYNLLSGVYRLFCVRCDHEALKILAEQIYDGLINEIK